MEVSSEMTWGWTPQKDVVYRSTHSLRLRTAWSRKRAQAAAMAQVFSTPELLEMILRLIPVKQLFTAQRVNTCFRNVLQSSPALQRAKFLQFEYASLTSVPATTSRYELLSPLMEEYFRTTYKSGELGGCYYSIDLGDLGSERLASYEYFSPPRALGHPILKTWPNFGNPGMTWSQTKLTSVSCHCRVEFGFRYFRGFEHFQCIFEFPASANATLGDLNRGIEVCVDTMGPRQKRFKVDKDGVVLECSIA